MWYIYAFAAISVAGLIWLIFKSRELTASQLKIRKDRKAARGRFLRGAEAASPATSTVAPNKRPKFGQR